MARIPKYVLAEKNLQTYLEQSEKKVFSHHELVVILEENRHKWGFAVTTSVGKLITRLTDKGIFNLIKLYGENRTLDRYTYKEPSIYDIAISIRAKSFISHYSALLLNNLTNQIPKTIYTTHELSPKILKPTELSQDSIDAAFSQPQRRSVQELIFGDYKIVLLEGKHTNLAGVTKLNGVYMSNLERTLIDCTVRPNYSGGCFSVLEAYKKSIMLELSFNKLLALLGKYNFIYPYHQAIGFYLERAGYTGKYLALLKNKPFEFDFYLDYDMEEPEYDSNWKIYYPKGM